MRRMVGIASVSVAVAVAATGTVAYWRRHPRVGTGFVNVVVNPVLLRRGLAGGERSELGTIEHVGRKSRARRLTPVHPEPTSEGFRIMVPLGTHSEWALNVLAAGHCRLQLHDSVFELDEPALVPARDVGDLPVAVRGLMRVLGFQYLTLRTFGVDQGALEALDADLVVTVPDDTETSIEAVPVPEMQLAVG